MSFADGARLGPSEILCALGTFVGLIAPGQTDVRAMTTQIHVIVNWFEELRARVPSAK
jgi:hypothetical protein